MNLPLNYEERIKLVDRITNQDLFNFNEILKFKEKNMLEQGDLFIIDKNGEYWFAIIYLSNNWYAITGDYKIIEITEKELLQYKFYNKNLFGSPYQDFIKREGKEKFDKLSMKDKCDVYVGNYFTKRLNETMEGLKNTLENLVRDLEQDK